MGLSHWTSALARKLVGSGVIPCYLFGRKRFRWTNHDGDTQPVAFAKLRKARPAPQRGQRTTARVAVAKTCPD